MAIGTPTERYAVTSSPGAVSTFNISPATTIAAGTVCVAMICNNGGGKVVTSMSDSVGNTWTVDATKSDSPRAVSICSGQIVTQITSGNTITINYGNATSFTANVSLQEVTGLATSSVFDQTANGSNATGANATTGNTSTLAQANEIVFAALNSNVSQTGAVTAGSGWTLTTTPTLSGQGAAWEYKIVAATTAVAGAMTISSSNWDLLIATYKMASAAAVVRSDLGLLGVG